MSNYPNLGFQNFYEETLTADLAPGAMTVTVSNAPTPTEGFLVIEPDTTSREIIWYNAKVGNVLTIAVGGRGFDGTTDVQHLQGARVIMAPTAEMFRLISNAAALLETNSVQGWVPASGTFTYASNNGQKEYVLASSTDQTSLLSPGMRFKFNRPAGYTTQCADFESSSSQSATRAAAGVAGVSFTNSFTAEAWIKPESYTALTQTIIRRGPNSDGWGLRLDALGRVDIFGGITSTYDIHRSHVKVPTGEWTHVAATIDLATNICNVYINGTAVVTFQFLATGASISNTGDLSIGKSSGGADEYFDGKIAHVRVWSTVRTAAQIRDNMNVALTTATGLVLNYPLNGDFNDVSGNGNNLTANGGVTATTVDNPQKATEYGIITKVTSTQVTLFTGTDYNVPGTGTLTNFFYSTQKAPFGFDAAESKWTLDAASFFDTGNVGMGAYNTDYEIPAMRLVLPYGPWFVAQQVSLYQSGSVAGPIIFRVITSVNNAAVGVGRFGVNANSAEQNADYARVFTINNTEAGQIDVKCIYNSGSGGGSVFYRILGNSIGDTYRTTAKCAYL